MLLPMTPSRRTMVGVGTLVALSSCAGASSAASAQPAYRHYHSRPDLKPPRVEILTRTPRTTPGYIFIAPKKKAAQTGPLIVDNYGNVAWFLPVETRGVTDFRVQRYQGRRVLTWWRSRSEDGDDVGRYSIYDSSYRLVKHVRPGNELTGDMHEFVITSRNTALMTLSHRVSVKGRSVLEGALQELDLRTGRVVFEWHSIDHVRLVESYYRLPGNPDRVYDYFHINSIAIDHDGNLLVSARNTHTVYKISRRTGEILWRLGGRRSDFSLGLVLRLDEKRMRATLVRTFVHDPPLVAVDQGNLQRLPNGHYLVGWGHLPYFTEFGPRGKKVFDGRFGHVGVDSYRAYRFAWIGRPRYRPSVALDGSALYVSWNGATEVARWQLLGGRRRNELAPVVTVRKRSFETEIPLPPGVDYVAVRALDRKSRSMARSDTLRRR